MIELLKLDAGMDQTILVGPQRHPRAVQFDALGPLLSEHPRTRCGPSTIDCIQVTARPRCVQQGRGVWCLLLHHPHRGRAQSIHYTGTRSGRIPIRSHEMSRQPPGGVAMPPLATILSAMTPRPHLIRFTTGANTRTLLTHTYRAYSSFTYYQTTTTLPYCHTVTKHCKLRPRSSAHAATPSSDGHLAYMRACHTVGCPQRSVI